MRHKKQTETGTRSILLRVPLFALGFAIAIGAYLGAFGVQTSGFTMALATIQIIRILCGCVLCYLLLGLLAVLPMLFGAARKTDISRAERRMVFAMTTVTVWVFSTLAFLPVKGSETFVRAGTLTTFQLNMIGVAVVLVGGLLLGWVTALIGVQLLALLRNTLTKRGMHTVGITALLIAVLILAMGPSLRSGARPRFSLPAGTTPTGMPRVVVIGVDGCDWEMLGPLVEAGELPNFERLMERGWHGPLLSSEPMISPRIWTTIATGKVPDKHGILGFVDLNGVPVNAAMRSAPAIWEIVSGYGGIVGVIGWYVTWPADDVNGFMISDRVHSLMRGPLQILHTIEGQPTNERLRSFGSFAFDAGYKRLDTGNKRYQQNRIVDEPLRWGYLRDEIYAGMADVFIPRYDPNFSAIYLRGIDFVQHFFWQYSDPEPFGSVTPEDIRAYGDVIPNYYRYTDRLLGRLLESVGDDTNVLLVSDHGFQPRLELNPSMPQLTGMHHEHGVIIGAGPAFQRLGRFDDATILDVAPTCLAVLGLAVPDDMDGRILLETIRPSHFERYPLNSVASYDSAIARESEELGSTMDESIKEQLRSLGYIE
jgi:hypothetical protein